MGLFDVEKEHIEQLDSKNLIRILRKLLTLEANKFGIPQSAANVYLNINDPDGGEDGRIKWENGPPKTDWIPNRFSMFQSKAQPLTSKDCEKEILNGKREIKPKVKEVLDAGGSYIFFCHKAYNDRYIDPKISKIVNTLTDKGYPNTVKKQVAFYDGNIISNWVNQYFTAQVFVMELLGKHPIPGLQTWEKWDAVFQDKKYFRSDKLNGWIGEIRKKLVNSQKNVIRITGLSGLGKTRLVLEALRSPDDKNNIEQAGISDSAVYYEASSDESPIKQFITGYRDCKNVTFVIDECGLTLHSSITYDVSAEDSNINLVTICNEPDYTRVPKTEKISLEPEDFKNVVKDMLNDTYKGKLSDNDISKITEFAGGFPIIAVELAKSRLQGSTALEPTDDNLVRKILWGQKNEDDKQMSILQACSIFKHFKLEDESGKIDEQSKFICDVVTIDEDIKGKHNVFCSTIKEFAKRKIIQKHGRYYGIEPVPLALRLAKQWWERAMSSKITEVIEKVESKELLEHFCEQSRRFDCIPQAADLIEKLCGSSCPFGSAEVVLSVAGSRIFRSFAEVNPKTVADCLFRILTSSEVKAINIVDRVRRNLVWALESLCWHEGTFEKAATMLKILALAENESWGNNSTGIFLQLFHIGLPGTKATLFQRQEIINSMINSGDIEQKKLAVKAIKNVFQSGHFSRGGGVESQGTKAPEHDYYPTSKEEVERYWKTNLEILTNLITSGGTVADEAKNTFADISGALIRHGYISYMEKSVNRVLQTGIFWHEMLAKIENLLIREDNKFDDNTIKRLQALSSSLEPRAWPDKVKHYISIPDWLHRKGKDGHYINLSDEKAEHLADELSESDELWNLLPLLYEGEQRQGFTFGKRLAGKLKDVSRFTRQSLVVLEECQSPNISVLGGFLLGLNDDSVFMQVLLELSKSNKLVRYVPTLLKFANVTKEYLDFILKLLEEHILTIDDLAVLRYGNPLGRLEPKEVMSFCGNIANFGIHGARQALEILYMYCFGTPTRFEQCREELVAIISTKGLLSGDLDKLDIHTWSDLVKKYIPDSPVEFSEHICKELLAFCSSDISNKLGSFRELKDIAAKLFENTYKITWPYFGKALLEKDNWEVKFGVEHLLETECGEVKKADKSPLTQIPYDYLKCWCKQNVPQGPATIMKLLPVLWEENDSSYGMDELSRKLLLDFGNYEEVQHAMSCQIFSFASWGSREPYYLRRIDILKDFKKSVRDKSLKTWIDTIITGLEREAQKSKAEHDEFEAGIIDR